MKRSYKILIILLSICFGSFCFTVIVTGLFSLIYPRANLGSPPAEFMYPSPYPWIDYLYWHVNPILGNFFEIMVPIVIAYSVFVFRHKILQYLT